MKTTIILSFAVLVLAGSAWSQDAAVAPKSVTLPTDGRGNSKVAHGGESVDQMIYDFMAEHQIPGLTLAIVQAPYITRVVGYGLSDIAQERLASQNTVWAIGPISQAYTAVAVMQLFEANKLDLKDGISKYISSLPASWAGITVLQLLQHATGLADYRAQSGYDPSKNQSSDELVAMASKIPLAFTPGTDVAQSATNFLLLAMVVEKASGSSYRDFVTKNQIDALGLKHTFFSADLSRIQEEDVSANKNKHKDFLKVVALIDPAEHATGYTSSLVPVPAARFDCKGFSDIWASATDVSLWDIGLAGSLLITKPENRAMIYKPTKLDNGKTVPSMAGWQFYNHKGLMEIKGASRGFSTSLTRFTNPSELICVTLLANKEGVDFSNLSRKIASAFASVLQSGGDDGKLYLRESVFGATETMTRIESELKKRNMQVFAKFDHAQNAKDVQLDLRPTQVIVFGSPVVGTELMVTEQSMAVDLPLRISVWEDAKGSVWVAFPQMEKLAESFGVKGNAAVGKSQVMMQEILEKACSIY